MAPASNSLVTRPLAELEGRFFAHADASYPLDEMTASVGAMQPGRVLVTIADRGIGPLAELHLAPADALELASRLLRMAEAVYQAVNERSNPR